MKNQTLSENLKRSSSTRYAVESAIAMSKSSHGKTWEQCQQELSKKIAPWDNIK